MRDNPLIGKVVTAVFLTDDGSAIKFEVEGGEPIVAHAEGDCCSHSWIENVQGVEQLLDSRVVSVEDIEMPEPTAEPTVKGESSEFVHNRYGHYEEQMAYYGCKITTEKGFATIDYRNSSNGYYGGSLSWPNEYSYANYGQSSVTPEGTAWVRVTA
jgi:hypothetical protein